MGSHMAGKAMGKAAEMALKMRTNQTALQLLDMICEPWRGCDAEFESEDPNNPGNIHPDYDSYTDPKGPLGVLIIEAFAAECNYVTGWPKEDVVEAWWEGLYSEFSARYEFC